MSRAARRTPIPVSSVIEDGSGHYYLPPVWGFFALRWLRRDRYL